MKYFPSLSLSFHKFQTHPKYFIVMNKCLSNYLQIKEAEGGILFVDEAYRLIPMQKADKDYGLEALDEIMSVMDSGKVVVIFAGYSEPMKVRNFF